MAVSTLAIEAMEPMAAQMDIPYDRVVFAVFVERHKGTVEVFDRVSKRLQILKVEAAREAA